MVSEQIQTELIAHDFQVVTTRDLVQSNHGTSEMESVISEVEIVGSLLNKMDLYA